MRQLEAVDMPEPARSAAVAFGAAAPRLRLDEALVALATAPPRRVIDFWYQHRVLRLATARLGEFGTGPAAVILAAGADRLADADGRTAQLRHTWNVLADACARLGISAAGIKGVAIESCYETIGPRDLGDIDLMTSDADDAWRLVAWLRDAGWAYHKQELPWLKRSPAGQLYGQAILVGPAGARLDVHFGGYSIRHNGFVLAPARSATGLGLADLAENFAYLLGNSAGDYAVRLKEINDLYAYLSIADFDWAGARGLAQEVCLEGYFNELLRAVDEQLALDDTQRALLRGLRYPDAVAESPGFGVPSLKARRQATVKHARRYRRRVHNSHGWLSAAKAAIYYRMPLRLSTLVVPGFPRSRLVRRLRTDRCVRLLPAVPGSVASGSANLVRLGELTGSRVLRLASVGRRQYVVSGRDLFVPTVYFLVSRSVLKQAATVAAHISGGEQS